MSLQSSFGYPGKRFSVVNDDCICFINGSSVCVWNTAIGKKDFLKPTKNGYTACTANYMKGFIAAAEYGIDPDIHIYKYPGNQMVAKIKAETKIQCKDLAFSRDCTRLLMIGDRPDFKISVYDLDKRKMLTINESLKDKQYFKAEFNPADPDQFYVCSPNTLTFYSIIHNSYKMKFQDNGVPDIDKCERVNTAIFNPKRDEESLEVLPVTYRDVTWDAYSKLYITTDEKILYQIDFNTGEEKMRLNLSDLATSMVLTQRHLIVSLEDKRIVWYSAQPPEETAHTQQLLQKDKLTRLEDHIMQDYIFENGNINCMSYTKSFKKLVIGCSDGFLATLPIEAELENEEDEEEEDDADKEMKTLDTPLNELTFSHTQCINGIKELGETTQLVTVGDDKLLCLWEATTGSLLARENLGSKLTALEASSDGNKIYVGSEGGVVRVYDVSNRCLPRLVKIHKFYDTPVSKICISHDERIVAAMSKESKEICFFHQAERNEFEFLCYAKLPAKVKDICWNTKNQEMRLIGLTHNCLMFSMRVMVGGVENIREPLPDDVTFPLYTKVDIGSYMINSETEHGEIYVIGDDKYLKKYQLPTEQYENINWNNPAEEAKEFQRSHGIATTCMDFSLLEPKFIATGGKDGNIILRSKDKINSFSDIKAHAVFSGGVNALCFSKKRTTLYTCGGDGSFLAWSVGKNPNPQQAVEPADIFSSPDLSNIPQVENTDDESVRYFKDLLEEQFLDSEVPRKEEFKKHLSKELKQLQDKLYELLEDNKKAQEIEQLERHEFVIDVKKKQEIENKAEEEREQIRKDAKREELRLECLRERVKNNTWDTMNTHLTACCSLDSDRLLYNYAIREQTPKEVRRVEQILHIRRMELREQISASDKQLVDLLNQLEFSTRKENYIMDRFQGVQKCENDETAPPPVQPTKSPMKRKKEKKVEMAQAAENQDAQGKRRPKMDLNQFRLGVNKPKANEDDEFADKMRDRAAHREEEKIDQLKWKIKTKRREIEDLRKNLYQIEVWDLIYEPFELYTDARKRMQITMLHEVVTKLKQDFNKEFSDFQKFKDDQIFIIQEKNNRINEILEDLGSTDNLFEPKQHKTETPEHILKVDPSEVGVEKFLTAEERAIEDEKRRIEEERLKALEGDNVGQRGIKIMLGGTIEIKKNKGIMEETIEKEEWMNKPIEEMSEEEKLKLKEFELKVKELEEEKQKKIKAWDQEIRKLKIEIDEIRYKFEDELRIKNKKRLFYDMRIYEQELYIIRLTLMLHENSEIKEEAIIAEKKAKIEAELEEARNQITKFSKFHDDMSQEKESNTYAADQEKALKQKFHSSHRAIIKFVKEGGKAAARMHSGAAIQEREQKEKEMMAHLNELDPYIIVDKNEIKKIVAEQNSNETYSYEEEKITGINMEEFDELVQERYSRIEMDKKAKELDEEINNVKEHITFCRLNADELNEALEEISESHQEIQNRMTRLKYNFEIVIYLLQGRVEIPQAPVATDYKDAILIKTNVIDAENGQIIEKGNKNVKKLIAIKDDKKKLSKQEWENKKLLLEIEDLKERAKDVQLYKVKKETQEIIKGNHRNKDEDEKANIDKQMKQYEDNANSRIKIINEKKKKLKKDIKDKKQENEQLEIRARQLKQNVEQRNQIIKLKSKGADDNVQDPKKKFKQISLIRKYKEILEQQKEEIEFLEDELERHRSRTFPSFANMHSRQDYAD